MTTKTASAPVPETPPPPPAPDLGAFAEIIGNAVAAGIAKNSAPRKVTFGEYARRPTANHPLGPKGPQFKRVYSQNGFMLEYATTTDRQIELLNRLTHSGRYIERMVEVIVHNEGSEESVEIRFNNKRDAALVLARHARDFTDMLEQIVKAQEAEDHELAERTDKKPRRYFPNADVA
jgi:hypothetical protein